MNSTEEKIILAATKLFSSKGYDATKTKEIAATAGISEVTLFKYFPSKKDLYLKVSADNLHSLKFKRIFEDNSDLEFEALLKTVLLEVTKDFYANKEIISMHLKEKSGLMPDRNIKMLDNPLFKQALSHFEKAVDENLIKGDPEKLCSILILTFNGICIQSILLDLDEEVFYSLVETHLDIFFKGILINEGENL